jgi:hypothetical protein
LKILLAYPRFSEVIFGTYLKFSNHDVKIVKPATYLDPWIFVDHCFSKKLFGSCIGLVPWHRFVRSKMNYIVTKPWIPRYGDEM